MSNTGFHGINVRQTTNQLVFRAFLVNNVGAQITTGTTSLYLYELQSDGTLKSYDFSNNTFTTSALTTETVNMAHQGGNNWATNTGIWTYSLGILTGFTVGAIYIAEISNSLSFPIIQSREWQFGSAEGDDGAFVAGVVGYNSTTTSIRSNRTEATNFWNKCVIAFTSGVLRGIAIKCLSYNSTNGAFTPVATLPTVPSQGDTFLIFGHLE